jgi:VanZ family protein
MAGIFWLSSIPGEELPPLNFTFSDKFAHLTVYTLLGMLIALREGFGSFVITGGVKAWTRAGWIAPAIGVLYGAMDELHQYFVPNREMDIWDFVADLVGVALGFWLARHADRARIERSGVGSRE